MRYLLFTLLGSAFYLLGATFIYGAYGELDILSLSQRVRPEPAIWVAIGLMTAGLLSKTALFPLHLWLPPVHAGAPAPASAMLSALVVKASFFLVARLWLNLTPWPMNAAPTQILGVLGAAAVLFGSVLELRQERLKLLIAYSTVAQIGYLFLMLPLASGAHPWSDAAWTGGILQAVSHAFAKAAMFLAAGIVAETLGHDRISGLRGIGRALPMAAFAFGLGGMSLMGLPPSGGGRGELAAPDRRGRKRPEGTFGDGLRRHVVSTIGDCNNSFYGAARNAGPRGSGARPDRALVGYDSRLDRRSLGATSVYEK
jgi:formate hydrogenlyase subunit 3/multisubunit Na+/H+ antiporter MnhD subunit